MSGTDRPVTNSSGEERQERRRAKTEWCDVVFPPSKPRVGLPSQEAGAVLCGTQESLRKGEVLRRALPEREYLFPGRAALRSGKQLTHRPQCQMSVSGLRTSVPGTARVWSAVADTPAEHPGCVVWVAAETHKRPRPRVAFFLPGRVRRASARESPCQTPEVGRQE